MLKVISKDDLSFAVDFAWKLNQKLETSSYPLYEDRNKIEESFKKSLYKNNSRLLGYYENNKLIAVINFFFVEDEKYLQTTGVYISDQYYEVMNALIIMLRSEYANYRALFGFPKENINAKKFFQENGYECIDSCLDMRLNKVNFKEIKHNDNIFKLRKADFDSYASFHDEKFQSIYWTSKRLQEALDYWHIFIYRPEDTIEGSIFIKVCDENTVEVFGLSVSDEYIGKGIESALLSQGLKNLFRDRPSINKTIFFINDDESEELDMVQKVGFHYFSSYRCYQAWL